MTYPTNRELLHEMAADGNVKLLEFAGTGGANHVDPDDIDHTIGRYTSGRLFDAHVTGADYETGHSHEWTLTDDVTLSDLNHASPLAVTVYSVGVTWGPEEGGTPYYTYHPETVYLLDRSVTAREAVEAIGDALIDHYGEDRAKDSFTIRVENVILTGTSVGGQHYC